jgi:hypothetical protein
MTKKRRELLDRIKKEAEDAGTIADIEDLAKAPLSELRIASVYLQLHKKQV